MSNTSHILDLSHITELAQRNFKRNREIAQDQTSEYKRGYYNGQALAYRRIWKRLEGCCAEYKEKTSQS